MSGISTHALLYQSYGTLFLHMVWVDPGKGMLPQWASNSGRMSSTMTTTPKKQLDLIRKKKIKKLK